MTNLYIGVMSGTSLDGIDISLCEISDSDCKLLAFDSYPFELKDEVLNIINNEVHISKIGELDHKLGAMYAKHINEFIDTHNIQNSEIKAIGLHGQTLWHEPTKHFSMQLGDANIVAYATGIAVVSDVRRADMAAGGQGAPFAPAFHSFLFGGEKTAVVNIGGMANVSILGEKIIGYDTGCGNVLLDSWIEKCQNKSYDKNGEWARSGKLDEALLAEFLSDEYFAKSHPKSTGREYFNLAWIEGKLSSHSEFISESKSNEILKQVQHDKQDEIPKQVQHDEQNEIQKQVLHDKQVQADTQRTLLELTAKSIAIEIAKFDINRVVLCGGGTKNIFLIERLKALLPKSDILISDELGVSSDAMESMMMAWLGFMRIQKREVNLQDVTGASVNRILGGLYEPN
jgi:anhydro-N-acetylmuramic acid kinase